MRMKKLNMTKVDVGQSDTLESMIPTLNDKREKLLKNINSISKSYLLKFCKFEVWCVYV